MGIRFHCPTCSHRLNVKAFLAGKRGVCPQCGAGLDIPLESQIHKKERSEKKRAAKPPGRDKIESVESEDLMTVPVSAPASVDDVPAAVSGGPQLTVPTSSAPKAEAAAASPVASLATAAAPSTPTPGSVPIQPITPVQPVAPVVTLAPAAPADPIDESPESTWYVRPPSGGQYGPARGEIMRKWITEGRVSADSLVWREGWDDWLTASHVFPSLGSASVPPVPAPDPAAPAAFGPASPAPTQPNSSLRPRRRNSSAQAITIVALLGLVVVGLLVTLIVVMNS